MAAERGRLEGEEVEAHFDSTWQLAASRSLPAAGAAAVAPDRWAVGWRVPAAARKTTSSSTTAGLLTAVGAHSPRGLYH